MTGLNVANCTLAIMDNLRFLRALNNECIDLIAIDPPFAANETFTGRPKPAISGILDATDSQNHCQHIVVGAERTAPLTLAHCQPRSHCTTIFFPERVGGRQLRGNVSCAQPGQWPK